MYIKAMGPIQRNIFSGLKEPKFLLYQAICKKVSMKCGKLRWKIKKTCIPCCSKLWFNEMMILLKKFVSK